MLMGSFSDFLRNAFFSLCKITNGHPFSIALYQTSVDFEEEISSMSFFSLSRTPLTFVIKSNLLDFKDFAIAPAAVSPFIL